MRFTVLALCACLTWATAGATTEEQAEVVHLDGLNLTAAEAQALEARLQESPQDLEARAQLVGYYGLRAATDTTARQAHVKHLLWLIDNVPESPVHLFLPGVGIAHLFDETLYATARARWLGHIEREPSNAAFLANAAAFLSLREADLAIEFLTKAQSLDPDNPELPFRLAFVHRTRSLMTVRLEDDVNGPRSTSLLERKGPKAVRDAALAFEHFEHAYRLAGPEAGAFLLVELVKAAFDGQRYEDARSYATTMVHGEPSDWGHQQRAYHGNLILGRLELRDGDISSAQYHLLEAGKVAPAALNTPQGPSMALAQELLQQGEHETVLEYLELCQASSDSPRLHDWMALIKAGRTPDFGVNALN